MNVFDIFKETEYRFPRWKTHIAHATAGGSATLVAGVVFQISPFYACLVGSLFLPAAVEALQQLFTKSPNSPKTVLLDLTTYQPVWLLYIFARFGIVPLLLSSIVMFVNYVLVFKWSLEGRAS